jgi:hypothetical protein
MGQLRQTNCGGFTYMRMMMTAETTTTTTTTTTFVHVQILVFLD